MLTFRRSSVNRNLLPSYGAHLVEPSTTHPIGEARNTQSKQPIKRTHLSGFFANLAIKNAHLWAGTRRKGTVFPHWSRQTVADLQKFSPNRGIFSS